LARPSPTNRTSGRSSPTSTPCNLASRQSKP
jgi:hypothetical protein